MRWPPTVPGKRAEGLATDTGPPAPRDPPRLRRADKRRKPAAGKHRLPSVVRRSPSVDLASDPGLLLSHVASQCAQRCKYRGVVVVRFELNFVLFGHFQSDFKDVDRIKPQCAPVQGWIRIDIRRCHGQIQRLNDQQSHLRQQELRPGFDVRSGEAHSKYLEICGFDSAWRTSM